MKLFFRLTFMPAMLALTWFGFVGGIDGARYVVTFYIWAFCLPIWLLSLSEEATKSIAKIPKSSRFMTLYVRLFNWSALLLIVWTGHFATSGAFLLCLFLDAVAEERAKKHRVENAV